MIVSKNPAPKNNRALIGYNNLLVSSNFAPAEAVLTPNTYERWTQSNNNNMVARFQLATNQTINFFAIAAHNMASVDIEEIQFSTGETIGGSLTLREVFPIVNDDAFFIYLDEPLENVAEVQFFIPQVDTNQTIEIGVFYCGFALEMQQPIYGGHSPIALSAKTSYQSPMSETGQFLGRNITSQGSESTFSWRHLEPDWYREYFQPFVESAKRLPFFIQWRPDLYTSATFGHTTGDISPTNMGGGHKLMSVDFTMRGHSD